MLRQLRYTYSEVPVMLLSSLLRILSALLMLSDYWVQIAESLSIPAEISSDEWIAKSTVNSRMVIAPGGMGDIPA